MAKFPTEARHGTMGAQEGTGHERRTRDANA
jgi:hypothetical protein